MFQTINQKGMGRRLDDEWCDSMIQGIRFLWMMHVGQFSQDLHRSLVVKNGDTSKDIP